MVTILVGIPATTQAFAMAPSQAAQTTIQSETTLGASLPGIMLTVDGNRYATPFSLTLQGSHTLAARTIPYSNGVFYRFVRWEDETGATISNTISFTYDFQKAKVISAVFAPPPSGKLVWSWDFESGTQWDDSGPLPGVGCGNNPGQVVTTQAHSGTRSGYYTIPSSHQSTCGSWPSLDFVDYSGTPKSTIPTVREFKYELWVYIPYTTFNGWIVLGNVFYDNWSPIAWVNTDLPERKLFMSDYLFTGQDTYTYQKGTGIQWPFDKWFKIGLEIHLKPSNEISSMILYQDNVEIARREVHSIYTAATLPKLWGFHWGLYCGGTGPFTIYNDDLAIYDLT